MPKCLSCLRGFTEECRGGDCDSLKSDSNSDAEEPDLSITGDTDEDDEESERTVQSGRFRRNKPDAALKDQQSTGRKRAARLYPLHPDKPCEWQFSTSAGGGGKPITGCIDGLQQARHHGPDKNTLNNDKGNVHRICHSCHNRWHAANDPNYDPNKPLKH